MTKKAKIELNDGRIMNLELYADIAPKTVDNFVKLCKENFYESLCFHRVIPNFMIQGGGFSIKESQLVQKPAASIPGEFAGNRIPNNIHHEAGVISMARTSDPNSASSQFFICVADCAYLDGQYAAFGKLSDSDSIEVAKDISKVKTGKWMALDDVPKEPIIIKRISIEE